MSMKFYRIVLHKDGQDREIRVPSPTDVQAADAAAPLMRPGETIASITQVDDDGLQRADGLPPKTQAEALADVSPGASAGD